MKNNYLILFFVICLVFFLPFLIKPDLLALKDNDLGRTYIPLFSFLRDSIFYYKQIPLWRPDQMMGETFIGNPLSSLFYPANLLFLIFPIKFASIIYLFIHFLLAGVFIYLLSRSFKLLPLSSFAAALFYAFSTKMIFHLSAGHITMIAAFSYFPLTLLSIRTIFVPKRVRPLLGVAPLTWIIIGAVSLTFMLMTYPTIFYYALIFLATYWAYRVLVSAWITKSLEIVAIKKQVINIFFTIVIFLGFSAIFILPQAEFAPFSTRSRLTIEDVAIPAWNLKRLVTSLIFPYLNFNSLDHESFLYLGLISSLFSIIGFFKLSRLKKIVLLFGGFAALLFIAGLSTPLFEFFYNFVPFLKYSRVTTRLWFIVALIVALLSAFALEKFKRKSIIYLILLIFLAESFFIGYRKINSIPNLIFTNEPLYQFLAEDKGFYRVYCTTYCFNPQLISKYKIQVLHGETPIQDANFIDFLQAAGGYEYSKFAVIFPPYQVWQKDDLPQPNINLLSLANVKYVASTYPITDSDLIFINQFEKIYLYQNQKYKPRAYFNNLADEVIIEKYSPNSIQVQFSERPESRILIFAENFYPGWFAFQDHQKFPAERKEPVFRRVNVLPNTKTLELKYQPETFNTGKTISLTIIFMLFLWYIHKRRSSKVKNRS